ncbi:PE-PGRS family protein [Streptomyces sp. A0592]|uniref:PE-PGRS family protein n=1 Tax=Streptomyces sp. A0592 TaxID=2563099 RepID=UPI00109ECF76|nr:PE-PGRS family protein [Streptomyces sp. A0592]THA86362.1 PE-PGRS family protein [Streptomyces sp. A0592]
MSTRGVGETEGDWAGLFEGIEALAAQPSMRQAWLRGLRHIASADVLVRLLDVVDTSVIADLPTEVVDAVIAHPDRRVRGRLAETRRGMSIDQWARLIASETGADRGRFQWLATGRCPKVPEPRFERWARDPDPRIRLRALWFRGLPQEPARALAADPDPEVRAEACGYAWPYLDAGRRSALVDDPSPRVREAARRRAGFDRPMSRTEYDALTPAERWRAVPVQLLGRDLAEHLVRSGERGLRQNLVDNERLDADLITELAHDEDPHVRAAVAVRADVPEALRASISAGLPLDTPYWAVGWVEECHDDPDAMRRLARSASIGIRRSVARARHLPPDVVDRLSRDPDTHVSYNLASCCEDAPAELLLEVALGRHGGLLHLNHPNFPRHALLSFADDPDPLRRRLALESPESTPGLAERLADDPDERVRERAAADPRLSPPTVLRLLDSTPRTRRAALGNPRLPVPTLIRLLRAPDTAEDAAANPAIPKAVVRQLAELSCEEGAHSARKGRVL